MKTKHILELLVIAGIVLIVMAFPYAKMERTLARADAMWWEDCPGGQFCSPVSPLPPPQVQPTYTPLPTEVPKDQPACLATPTCPAPAVPVEPTAYPTQEPYPTYTPWPTQPPFEGE